MDHAQLHRFRVPQPPAKAKGAAPLESHLAAPLEHFAGTLSGWVPSEQRGRVRITTVPRLTTPVCVAAPTRGPHPPYTRPAKDSMKPTRHEVAREKRATAARVAPVVAPVVAPTLECHEDFDTDPLYDMPYTDALFRGRVGGRVVGTPISSLF